MVQCYISLFPQINESKKEEFELDISAIENKERQTKPDFKDVAVQSKPDCQEVAVQTHSEATAAGRATALFIAEIPDIVYKMGDSYLLFLFHWTFFSRLHSWGRGDWRNRIHSFPPRIFI